MPTLAEFRATDYLTGDEFWIAPTAAGWWKTRPQPANISRYYPPAYYGQGKRRFPAPIECVQRWLYRRRAAALTSLTSGPRRALDVGCGPGHLLAALRSRGWTVLGTEASEPAADVARQRHGVEVRVGELVALNLPGESFNAVVSWHTLEHMPDPEAVLDEFHRLLAPGGVLLLSVPNFGSTEAQVRPAAWFHLDVPRHLCHFPAEVLQAALERRGFRLETVRYTAAEYDVFSLLQTWQNRLCLPHNLLYLMLKSTTPRPTMPIRAWHRAAALGLAAASLAPALAVTTWRAWRRDGAVVVFLARKTGAAELREGR